MRPHRWIRLPKRIGQVERPRIFRKAFYLPAPMEFNISKRPWLVLRFNLYALCNAIPIISQSAQADFFDFHRP